MKKTLIISVIILITISAFSIEVKDIVRKLDNNEVYDSIKFEGDMDIYLSGKKYEKTFYSYAKGNKNFFMEFTNFDDQGTKYMKKEGNLFVYTEDLEEVMPITGHMLRESMMGSDLSYEDAIDNETLESQYNAKIIEETKFNGDTKFRGKDVWVLELNAKRKTVSYAKQKIWVDKETFAALKVEQYALSGAKLKEMLLLDAKWIDKRYFATEIQVKDLLRKDSKTVFKMNKIELD
ncbi:MAG: outer membrane lipoprotein-sorting protein, partial [Spirochaetes bacterium]|nr:outer membrane lipoprotein-sorting protein [Spirochaetota bacterium]